jgi:hypothetical protein
VVLIFIAMGHFVNELDVRWEKCDKVTVWKILSEFSYIRTNGDIIKVPVGFETDMASIPRIFWAIFPPTGEYSKAAVIHDYVLDSGMEFQDANNLMKECMNCSGVHPVTKRAIYLAVCLYAKYKSLRSRKK